MAQEVKNDIKKALQVNTIPLIAIMTAVTTVLTMLVKIPTPIRGYLNLSDTMIYFSAYAFGPWVGGIIGGLGPALSDLISGYPQWAIFTFVIDGLQAVLVGLLVKKFNPANIIIGSVIAGVWKVFGYFIAGVWKVFGYFIAGGILSGFGPALGEIAGNSFQMAVGLIVGFALFTAVRQAYPPLVRLGNLGIKAGE
ncbi:ECF transporter S component [Bifidobacterium catenulatum subsp. kashiwanohense]|uniref:ECF transporter S component n=1 Tax=Bifidobacterium catenulatum TaxID=1686 RepID=UPI003D052DB8